jgi:hypothetical protein
MCFWNENLVLEIQNLGGIPANKASKNPRKSGQGLILVNIPEFMIYYDIIVGIY